MNYPNNFIQNIMHEPLLLSLLSKVIHEYKALLDYSHAVKTNRVLSYKMIAKKFDHELQQYLFTLETAEQQRFTRTAEEISGDKALLSQLEIQDVHDVGYTLGSESVLKERAAILAAKKKVE